MGVRTFKSWARWTVKQVCWNKFQTKNNFKIKFAISDSIRLAILTNRGTLQIETKQEEEERSRGQRQAWNAVREPSEEKRVPVKQNRPIFSSRSPTVITHSGQGLTFETLRWRATLCSPWIPLAVPHFRCASLTLVLGFGPTHTEGSVLDPYPVDVRSVLTAEAEAAASPGNRVWSSGAAIGPDKCDDWPRAGSRDF